jgi:hypothetical protein
VLERAVKGGKVTSRCSQPVTIVIELEESVACPGLPFPMKAKGKPSGGTYTWAVSGGELVNDKGKLVNTGAEINLRSFLPDDAKGRIRESTANVGVTYSYEGGNDSAFTSVPIHKIEFDVTNMVIKSGVTQAREFETSLEFDNGPPTNGQTIAAEPMVKIILDASCPRKGECAQNHRSGWLQTVLSDATAIRYEHTILTYDIRPLPIRDARNTAPLKPFYNETIRFKADQDKQIVRHSDTPQHKALWRYPKQDPLQRVVLDTSFAAWLVVQNIEWSAYHPDESFVFVGNFTWSVRLETAVDLSREVGDRCQPASGSATPTEFERGKGKTSPVLGDPTANEAKYIVETPI